MTERLRSTFFFVLTVTSVTLFSMGGLLSGASWADALTFSFCLMGILLAHEMGHYVVARMHGFELSLPLFIPFPGGFGTMGAVIRLKSAPKSRQALLEMGVAGPIAGAVLAFVMLAVGLKLPTGAGPVPAPGEVVLIFNDPQIVRILGTLLNGEPPGRFAALHPAALAGWVGCMLTGINLLPLGQLDGGHVFNAVLPRWAAMLSLTGAVVLLAAGFLWPGWFVWGAMLLLLGAWRPMPVGVQPSLPLRSRVLAGVAILLFLLTFMPVPLETDVWPG